MKMKIFNLMLATVGAAALLASCDSYLDKLPDSRTEVDTEDKVTAILVSAYPNSLPILIQELGTDNVIDNGKQYGSSQNQEQLYKWQTVTTQGNDDPPMVWQNCYSAVATANLALQSIDNLGNPASLAPQRAEALLCRAYAMFELSNAFCMAYNPENADTMPGLPYPTVPETHVIVSYDRGTVAELYQKIDSDIEAALPNVDDNIYTVPKYHFNRAAAYAFAAKFNLFYMKYQKCVDYATEAIGEDPTAKMRNYTSLLTAVTTTDLCNKYVDAADPANLLLLPIYSSAARYLSYGSYPRYCHSSSLCSYETYWAKGPWGTSGSDNNLLFYGSNLYGSDTHVFFPKMLEFFEYTDKTAGVGYSHLVNPAFTVDKTVLDRAEAYALLGDQTNALKDLNYWMFSHCRSVTEKKPTVYLAKLTKLKLSRFIEGLTYEPSTVTANSERSIRKKLNPQGFTVAEGLQEDLIECVLHFRRIETVLEGDRWMDLKRYGIEFSHPQDGDNSILFKAGDLRGAIQLPEDVIKSGIPANPR